jgi:nucleoside triphosphatase
MRTRIVTVGIITNSEGKYLLCKMSSNHGVYPGKYGLVGGGVDENEEIDTAVEREIGEEVGLRVIDKKRLTFLDDRKTKIMRDGTTEEQYLIYLYYQVEAKGEVVLNDEWEDFGWYTAEEVQALDLNDKTRMVLQKLRIIE